MIVRMSQLVGRTLRSAPVGIESEGLEMLVRAGFVRRTKGGGFAQLPLARRSARRIEAMLEAGLEALGGQEAALPVAPGGGSPSGSQAGAAAAGLGEPGEPDGDGPPERLGQPDPVRDDELARAARALELADVRAEPHVPRMLYERWTRGDGRRRAAQGMYSPRGQRTLGYWCIDSDAARLAELSARVESALVDVIARCGVPVVSTVGVPGTSGGGAAQEHHFLTPSGTARLIYCGACGYAADADAAEAQRVPLPLRAPRPMKRVATPGANTIEALAAALKVGAHETAKAVFMIAGVGDGRAATGKLIIAVVRGDLGVNTAKLARAAGVVTLVPATHEQIAAAGAVPGYGSPVGITPGAALVVVDPTVSAAPGLVAGANEEGAHMLDVRCGRDYVPDVVADIAEVKPGDACPVCSSQLRGAVSVPLLRSVGLGEFLSALSFGRFADPDGGHRPLSCTAGEVRLDALLQAIAESNRDDAGLCWPPAVSPLDLHIVVLRGAEDHAEEIARSAETAGLDVLIDDRPASAGVKFSDADLIGIPLRMTVGPRGLDAGTVELVRRGAGRSTQVDVALSDAPRIAAEWASEPRSDARP